MRDRAACLLPFDFTPVRISPPPILAAGPPGRTGPNINGPNPAIFLDNPDPVNEPSLAALKFYAGDFALDTFPDGSQDGTE